MTHQTTQWDVYRWVAKQVYDTHRIDECQPLELKSEGRVCSSEAIQTVEWAATDEGTDEQEATL